MFSLFLVDRLVRNPTILPIHIGSLENKLKHQSMLYLRLTPEREVRIKDYFPLLKGLFFDFRDKNASKKE